MSTAGKLISNFTERTAKDSRSVGGILNAAIASHIDMLSCMLPAKVVAYSDRNSRRVVVQPLVRTLTRDGAFKDSQTIACMIQHFAANGFVIDLPISVGTVGWVMAADIEDSAVRNAHSVSDFSSLDTHRFEYGIFIPDYYGVLKDVERKNDLNPYEGEGNRLVISSFDGKQKVSIGRAQQQGEDIGNTTGDIKVESLTDSQHKTTIVIKNGVVTLDTTDKVDVNAGNTVNVTAGQSANVKSPIVTMAGVTGNTAVSITGTLTVTGNITSSGGEMVDKRGVTLGTHTHKYNPGPGDLTETVVPTVVPTVGS